MSYKIVPMKGHYEVYIDGEFYCTADSWSDAAREVEEHKAIRQMNNEDICNLCSKGYCVYNEDGVCTYEYKRFAEPSLKQCKSEV